MSTGGSRIRRAALVALVVAVILGYVSGSPAVARCVTVGVDSISHTQCGLP